MAVEAAQGRRLAPRTSSTSVTWELHRPRGCRQPPPRPIRLLSAEALPLEWERKGERRVDDVRPLIRVAGDVRRRRHDDRRVGNRRAEPAAGRVGHAGLPGHRPGRSAGTADTSMDRARREPARGVGAAGRRAGAHRRGGRGEGTSWTRPTLGRATRRRTRRVTELQPAAERPARITGRTAPTQAAEPVVGRGTVSRRRRRNPRPLRRRPTRAAPAAPRRTRVARGRGEGARAQTADRRHPTGAQCSRGTGAGARAGTAGGKAAAAKADAAPAARGKQDSAEESGTRRKRGGRTGRSSRSATAAVELTADRAGGASATVSRSAAT